MARSALGRALRPLALALLAGAAWSAAAQERTSPVEAAPAPDTTATDAGDPPTDPAAPGGDEAAAAAGTAPPAEAPVARPAPGTAGADALPNDAATAPSVEAPEAATAAPAEAPVAGPEAGTGDLPSEAAAPSADEAPRATAAGAPAAPTPEPGLGPDEVGRRVAETYDVDVLRVREAEADGRPVYAVTVMLPGGDRNNAFQVVTVLADPASGDVLPTFRHLPAGIEGNPGLEAETSTEAGIRAMRRQTFR